MSRDAVQNLDAGPLTLLAPDEGKKKRRFTMLANTGTPVQRMFGQAVFDLSGIETKPRIPILADHDSKLRVGVATEAKITEEGLRLSGFLLSNAAGKQIAAESDEGFPFQASVGLQVSQWLEVEAGDEVEVNGRTIAGPISVAVKSRLLESSFLMAGADQDTSAIALSNQKEAHMKMTPDEFQAANPEAVAAWKDEAAVSAREAQRTELGAYLATFPGREAWAQGQFIAGASLLEARAALSDVLTVELAEAKAASPPGPDPKAATLEALAAQAPGVGFDGQTQGQPAKPTAQTLWADPAVRAEFCGNQRAFLQAVSRGLIKELTG